MLSHKSLDLESTNRSIYGILGSIKMRKLQKDEKTTKKSWTIFTGNRIQVHSKRTETDWEIQRDISLSEKSQIIKLKI